MDADSIASDFGSMTIHALPFYDRPACIGCGSPGVEVVCSQCSSVVGRSCCQTCCETCVPEKSHPPTCPSCSVALAATLTCCTDRLSACSIGGMAMCSCTLGRRGGADPPSEPTCRAKHAGACVGQLWHKWHAANKRAAALRKQLRSAPHARVAPYRSGGVSSKLRFAYPNTLACVRRSLMAAVGNLGGASGVLSDQLGLWHTQAVTRAAEANAKRRAAEKAHDHDTLESFLQLDSEDEDQDDPVAFRVDGPARALPQVLHIGAVAAKPVVFHVATPTAQSPLCPDLLREMIIADMNPCLPWMLRLPERPVLRSHPVSTQICSAIFARVGLSVAADEHVGGKTWRPLYVHAAGLEAGAAPGGGQPGAMRAALATAETPDAVAAARRKAVVWGYFTAVIYTWSHGAAATAARLAEWDEAQCQQPIQAVLDYFLLNNMHPGLVRFRQALATFTQMQTGKPGFAASVETWTSATSQELPPRPEWVDFFFPTPLVLSHNGPSNCQRLLMATSAYWHSKGLTHAPLSPARVAAILSDVLDVCGRREWSPREERPGSGVRGPPVHAALAAAGAGAVALQQSADDCHIQAASVFGIGTLVEAFPDDHGQSLGGASAFRVDLDVEGFFATQHRAVLALAASQGYRGGSQPPVAFTKRSARASRFGLLPSAWFVDDGVALDEYRGHIGVRHYEDYAAPIVQLKLARTFPRTRQAQQGGYADGLRTWTSAHLATAHLTAFVLRHTPGDVVNLAMALLVTVAMDNQHREQRAATDTDLLGFEGDRMVDPCRRRLAEYGLWPEWVFQLQGHQFMRAVCNGLVGTRMRTNYPGSGGEAPPPAESFAGLRGLLGLVRLSDACAAWAEVQACREEAARSGLQLCQLYQDRFQVDFKRHPALLPGSAAHDAARLSQRRGGESQWKDRDGAALPVDVVAAMRDFVAGVPPRPAHPELSWDLPPPEPERAEWERRFQAQWTATVEQADGEPVCPADVARAFVVQVCLHFCLSQKDDALLLAANCTAAHDLMTQAMSAKLHETVVDGSSLHVHLYPEAAGADKEENLSGGFDENYPQSVLCRLMGSPVKLLD